MIEEENSFTIDVSAESQTLPSGFGSETPLPSEIVNVMGDDTLLKSVPYSAQPVQPTPEIKIFQSSQSETLLPSKKYESVEAQTNLISEKIEYIESDKLIPSEFNQATGFETKGSVVAQQSQIEGLNYTVKVDPEQVYEKTKKLQSQLDALQSGVNTMAGELNNSWIPNSNKDDFEERPLIEATNLIFENRRDKFSEPPMWC